MDLPFTEESFVSGPLKITCLFLQPLDGSFPQSFSFLLNLSHNNPQFLKVAAAVTGLSSH